MSYTFLVDKWEELDSYSLYSQGWPRTSGSLHCCPFASCQSWEICPGRCSFDLCLPYTTLDLMVAPFFPVTSGKLCFKGYSMVSASWKRMGSYNYNAPLSFYRGRQRTRFCHQSVPAITLGIAGSSHLPLRAWEKAPYYFSDSIRCWVNQQQPHREELKIERNGWHHPVASC